MIAKTSFKEVHKTPPNSLNIFKSQKQTSSNSNGKKKQKQSKTQQLPRTSQAAIINCGTHKQRSPNNAPPRSAPRPPRGSPAARLPGPRRPALRSLRWKRPGCALGPRRTEKGVFFWWFVVFFKNTKIVVFFDVFPFFVFKLQKCSFFGLKQVIKFWGWLVYSSVVFLRFSCLKFSFWYKISSGCCCARFSILIDFTWFYYPICVALKGHYITQTSKQRKITLATNFFSPKTKNNHQQNKGKPLKFKEKQRYSDITT